MFFEFSDIRREVSLSEISPDRFTAGYISRDEAAAVCDAFGFASSTAQAMQIANERFRSGVEVYEDYTFTELRILNTDASDGEDDCVALYISDRLFIVVDVEDRDGSTKNKFLSVLSRFTAKNAAPERLLSAFLDALVAGHEKYLEEVGMRLTRLENDVFRGKTGQEFNFDVLRLKEHLLRMHNYYEQLLDITEAVEENENELFDEDRLMYVSNLSKKVVRLREDVDSLSSLFSHLQDAYSAYLDLQMNRSMKIFTVLTSVFFPLTIITGWYGMNFTTMPELPWKYGYLYVILLSAAVSVSLIVFGKKRKWY